ncbi:HEPN domain-containing protein [Rufibacter soli]|jgi:HEPN domain-containing protein
MEPKANAQASQLFYEAIDKLNRAKEEYYKPEEDLMAYMVCKNAQFSIEKFLRGFLLQNEINPGEGTSVSSLFEECKRINKGFEQLDFTALHCKNENLDTRFCNDAPRACNCLNVSTNLETFLRKENVIA